MSPPKETAIEKVETEILPDPANPQLIVRVTTSDGITGVGETWWGTYQPTAPAGAPLAPLAAMIDSVMAPACLGRDASDIAGLWQHLYRATYQYGPEGITSSALAGIDLALWDLAGQRLGQPVAELLGGRVHDSLPAYASLHWLGDAELVAAEASRAVAEGFVGVKLHEFEAEMVLAARDAVGPEVALMMDASARLTDRETVELSRATKSADLTWIEEPIFPQQDHARLASLRPQLATRLAAGENEFSVAGFTRLVESGSVDVLQPDLVKCGGLSTAATLNNLADKHGIWLCPHNFSLGPSLGANIGWAMTAKSARWIEVPFLPEGQSFPGRWAMPHLSDGRISYSTRPGLAWD